MREHRRQLGGLLAAVSVAASCAFALGGPAANALPTAPVSGQTTSKDIPNLGEVKRKIWAYYGDTRPDGDHAPTADSDYAKELAGLQSGYRAYLTEALRSVPAGRKPALVFDVDDTTLLSYRYYRAHDFAYEADSYTEMVNAASMEPVFGMPALVNWADRAGYEVFFLTGRPQTQREGTARNLAGAGYRQQADDRHLFLRDRQSPPPYLTCGTTCTTIQYKSGTRAHIESLGYQVVANFGDQDTDLAGGYATRTFKLPNPMYYLP